MAYTLHIERTGSKIALSEWFEAVEAVNHARIQSADVQLVHPNSGQTISITSGPGDLEVVHMTAGFLGVGKKASWVPSIRFLDGTASFNANKDIESKKNPVHRVAKQLAQLLSAQIVGDEGEVYDW